MTFNDNLLTVAIDVLIISEGITFNLARKSIFEKVLALARNIYKAYITPIKKLTSKELLDVIHE